MLIQGLLVWWLLGAASVSPAQAGGIERVMLLGARTASASASAAPVSRRLLDAVDGATTEKLSQIGVPVLRRGRGEGSGCEAEDYDCLVRSSRQSVDLVVDVAVQRNDEANYFLTVVLFDARNPSETRREQAPLVSQADSKTAPREHDQSVAVKAASMLGSLLEARRAMASGSMAPGSANKQSYKLEVQVNGVGRVESELPPSGIDCPGGPCELAVLAKSAAPVVLVARPRSPSAFLGWEDAPCLASEGATWRCSLQLTDNLLVRARFGRTLGRKVAAPILLIGSIAGFSAAIGLGILNGQVKGPCMEPANLGKHCLYNEAGTAWLSAGIGTLLAVGAGLAWWLPWQSENNR